MVTKIVSLAKNIYFTRQNPVSLIHFVTNRCNARCSFCFIDFDDPNTFKKELSLLEIEQLTKHVGPSLQNVNLTGGEPFSRVDLLEVVRAWYINTNIRSIFITTNGSLPERIISLANKIKSEFPDRLLIFSISIDGLPELHNKIRKIANLFENAIKSYHGLKKIGGNIDVNIAITVSHENYKTAHELYEELSTNYGIKSITCTIVRDEGVYKIPKSVKENILNTYNKIIKRIQSDLKLNILQGYNADSLQGRLMNKKNVLMNNIISKIYLNPTYISPCHAGSLFGIIEANGNVKPCEILDNTIGNLRDYDMNFLKMWHGHDAQTLKSTIINSKCNCTYECAWSFNILGNWRYQPSLLMGALKL